LIDKPTPKIIATCKANGHDTSITIDVALLTTHDKIANMLRESECRLLTAQISLAIGRTSLCAFRGIDAEKPNTLAMHFQCVPVDHRGLASRPRRGPCK
jgi:hypothetical protein